VSEPLPAGLIEAVARAQYERDDWKRQWETVTGIAREAYLDGAVKGLLAAFSWRDDKPCETCGGAGEVVTNLGLSSDGPIEIVNCPAGCTPDGRVEGDRRVILARQVGHLTRFPEHEPPHDLGCIGMVWNRPSKSPFPEPEVPVFVATPVQEER
jgi:hypothetical protein